MTDWTREIVLADSQNRAAVLVRALEATPDAAGKAEMLASWFNICDAIGNNLGALREQFELADPVSDDEWRVDLPVVVYRGAYHDDDSVNALSWTTERSTAEFFARALVGLRSRIVLGMYRDDATPTIFQAVCTDAYGFLNGRGEHEILAKRVVDVHPIAELVPLQRAITFDP